MAVFIYPRREVEQVSHCPLSEQELNAPLNNPPGRTLCWLCQEKLSDPLNLTVPLYCPSRMHCIHIVHANANTHRPHTHAPSTHPCTVNTPKHRQHTQAPSTHPSTVNTPKHRQSTHTHIVNAQPHTIPLLSESITSAITALLLFNALH
jgi:hypothetical protein